MMSKVGDIKVLSVFLCSVMLPFDQCLPFEQLSIHQIDFEVVDILFLQPKLK